MQVLTYSQLALEWKPERKNNRQFILITTLVFFSMLVLVITASLIKVPEEKRQARVNVPERISKFLLDKVKPKPVPQVKPKPRPKPKPEKIVKPKVKKPLKLDKQKKPLTKTEKKAREKAANSGLLALGNELADLMDTSEVTDMLGGSIKSKSMSNASKKASNNSRALLLADAGKGSGGVDVSKYATTTSVGKTKLSQREITRVKQALLAPEVLKQAQVKSPDNKKTKAKQKPRSAGIRAEEGITVVFDQNKSQLYTIYNRARRKNPDLRGKIVLEITVAPSGKVTRIKVVSNELNDPKLETRLVNRIKQFNFGAQNVEEITVTYPIEFLPA